MLSKTSYENQTIFEHLTWWDIIIPLLKRTNTSLAHHKMILWKKRKKARERHRDNIYLTYAATRGVL